MEIFKIRYGDQAEQESWLSQKGRFSLCCAAFWSSWLLWWTRAVTQPRGTLHRTLALEAGVAEGPGVKLSDLEYGYTHRGLLDRSTPDSAIPLLGIYCHESIGDVHTHLCLRMYITEWNPLTTL